MSFTKTNFKCAALSWVIASMCIPGFMTGCGGKSYDGATRISLSGKVSLDGEPIDGGSISFIPVNIKQRVSGGDIVKGQYQVAEEKGAHAGAYRVEIHYHKPTGRKIDDTDTGTKIDEVADVIPPKYNTQSTLTADVSETKKSFDFELTTK